MLSEGAISRAISSTADQGEGLVWDSRIHACWLPSDSWGLLVATTLPTPYSLLVLKAEWGNSDLLGGV